MAGKLEFQEKLAQVLKLAQENNNKLSQEAVEEFFKEDSLTQEQMNLVNDYLLAKKVAVTGYIKANDITVEAISMSEDEEAYLREYESDLAIMKPESEGEMVSLYVEILNGSDVAKSRMSEIYLPYIIPVAKEMYKVGFHIADLIQEGNVAMIMTLETLITIEGVTKELIIEYINGEVKQGIQMLIEETTELRTRDQKMVDQVTKLDEIITQLTEDLGRKVTLEELSLYTEMSEDEIVEVLKLMGEEVEEAPEMNFKVEEGKMNE